LDSTKNDNKKKVKNNGKKQAEVPKEHAGNQK